MAYEKIEKKLFERAEAAGFPKAGMSRAEKRLIESVARGVKRDCSGLEGEDRDIRPGVFEWLLVHPAPRKLLHPRGVRLSGARFPKPVDLTDAEIGVPLWFWRCEFDGLLELDRARTKRISIEESKMTSIDAISASIDGDVSLSGSRLSMPGCRALSADGATIQGSVFLRTEHAKTPTSITGEACFIGATIGGNLECDGATLANENGRVLNADGATIQGSVFLRTKHAKTPTSITGEARFRGATIGGDFSCIGTTLANEKGRALNADGATIQGSVFLRTDDPETPTSITGEACFRRATIGGNLECGSATLANESGTALEVNGATIQGSVFLRTKHAKTRTSITGEACFLVATIGGNLDCIGATLANQNGRALNANGATIQGSVFLRTNDPETPTTITGETNLVRVEIGGSLQLQGGRFRPAPGSGGTGRAIVLTNARVEGFVSFVDHWRGTKPATIAGAVLLGHARVGQLDDGWRVWEPIDEDTNERRGFPIDLDGFEYRALGRHSLPSDKASLAWRLRWLERSTPFTPQPYTQLAKVLREAGHEAEAKEVLIAREKRRLDEPDLARPWRGEWIRLQLLRPIGFGYRPGRAVLALLAMIVIGAVVFQIGWAAQRFSPAVPFVYNSWQATPEYLGDIGAAEVPRHGRGPEGWKGLTDSLPDYPRFNALIFSVDALLPFVDMHQERYWLPRGWFFRGYLWLHIAAGWIGATLAVAGFTGLVRRD